MDAKELVAQIVATGNTPDPAYIAGRFGIPLEEANELILVAGREVSQDKGYVKTPRSKKAGNGDQTYYVPTRESPPLRIGTTVGSMGGLVVPAPAEKKTLREGVQAGLLALLPFIFFGASAVGSVRSFSIAKSFFLRINSEWDATIFAVLLVALAFAVPQSLPILWREVRQGKRVMMFVGAIVVSLATIGTSGFITATELFSQRTDKLTATDSNEAHRTQLEALITDKEAALAEARESLRMDKDERATLTAAIGGQEVGSVGYNRLRNNLASIKDRIDQGTDRASKIDADLGQLRADLAMIPPPSGAQVSREAEVAINVGIAFILEIGAPLSLSLALFL